MTPLAEDVYSGILMEQVKHDRYRLKFESTPKPSYAFVILVQMFSILSVYKVQLCVMSFLLSNLL